MAAYENMDVAIAGLTVGSIYDTRIEGTWVAKEIITFGEPAFGYEGNADDCYEAQEDTNTVLFDADFVAANIITFTITVDGTEQTPVAIPYNVGGQADTMADIVIALEAAITGLDATRTDISGDDRTLEIFVEGSTISTVAVVTLGSSQAGATITISTAQVFLGIARFDQKYVLSGNDGQYEVDDMVNVVAEGRIYVNCIEAVNANTSAYVVTTGANKGKFSLTSTDNYDVNCIFRATTTEAGLVPVEVRGQVNA